MLSSEVAKYGNLVFTVRSVCVELVSTTMVPTTMNRELEATWANEEWALNREDHLCLIFAA